MVFIMQIIESKWSRIISGGFTQRWTVIHLLVSFLRRDVLKSPGERKECDFCVHEKNMSLKKRFIDTELEEGR